MRVNTNSSRHENQFSSEIERQLYRLEPQTRQRPYILIHYSPEGEYCKYSTGQKTKRTIFTRSVGYNSAKSEPIGLWMKFGIL